MTTISISNMQQRRFNATERRPRMLKEFLSENSNSCSSSGFKSFPRKQIPPHTSYGMRSLIEIDLNSRNSNPRNMSKLSRSMSAKSAFQTLINAVKSISFTAVKANSPSILPRSLSRKLSRRNSQKESEKNGNEIQITVKIKDIIRWKSFRDLAEEQSPPQDLASSTTASTSTATTFSSNGSSWTDSDFSASWDGNFTEAAQNDVGAGKKYSPFVGKDSVEATTETTGYTAVGAKEVSSSQDEEQQSPVSVLQIGEDEFSLFNQNLANIERKTLKFLQTIQRFENLAKLDLTNSEKCQSEDENTDFEEDYDNDNNNEDERDEEQERIEEMARRLLHCAKAAHFEQCFKANVDKLLFDFFKDELNAGRNQTMSNDGFECEILRIAENWIEGSFEYDMGLQKEACIDDMNKRARWNKLEEEQEELGLEIEAAILDILVCEFVDDFSSN